MEDDPNEIIAAPGLKSSISSTNNRGMVINYHSSMPKLDLGTNDWAMVMIGVNLK